MPTFCPTTETYTHLTVNQRSVTISLLAYTHLTDSAGMWVFHIHRRWENSKSKIMIYRIHDEDANTLLEQPETGMGYQIVFASQYQRHGKKKLIVYNTNLAVDLDSDYSHNKRKIINEGYQVILNRSTELMLETDTIRVQNHSTIREPKILSSSKKINNGRHTGGRGATDSPKRNANGIDVFVRISAFEDDRRVDFENKKLKSGTFTTTVKDYRECVSTKDNPVDRYALPNDDDEISWSFYVQPKTTDTLQEGIVQPAFGQEGGGIEAFFENGTAKDTLVHKREYGK